MYRYSLGQHKWILYKVVHLCEEVPELGDVDQEILGVLKQAVQGGEELSLEVGCWEHQHHRKHGSMCTNLSEKASRKHVGYQLTTLNSRLLVFLDHRVQHSLNKPEGQFHNKSTWGLFDYAQGTDLNSPSNSICCELLWDLFDGCLKILKSLIWGPTPISINILKRAKKWVTLMCKYSSRSGPASLSTFSWEALASPVKGTLATWGVFS